MLSTNMHSHHDNENENGHLDIVNSKYISGWHYNSNGIQEVDIYVNGNFHSAVKSNNYRKDLEDLEIVPDGKAGFNVEVTLKSCDLVNVYAKNSSFELIGSPKICITNNFISINDALACSYLNEFLPINIHLIFSFILNFRLENLFISPIDKLDSRLSGFICRYKILENKDDYILLFKTDKKLKKILLAYDKVLKNIPILYPKIIHKYKGYIVFEFIKGEVLAKYGYNNLLLRDQHVLKKSLQSLSHINNLQYSPNSNIYKHHISTISLNALKLSIKKLLKLHFKESFFLINIVKHIYFSPRIFSHGDFHLGNIIYNEKHDSISIIDWESWGKFPVGYDVACLLRSFSNEHQIKLLDYYKTLIKDKKTYRHIEINFWIFSYLLSLYDDPDFSNKKRAKNLKSIIKLSI